MNNANGNNPASSAGAVMPAGYQAELNYIWSLVEELSKQLADNRKKTDEIVSNIGKVRQRARDQNIPTHDLIAAAADGLNAQSANYEEQISILEEALDKTKHSRDSNMRLLQDFRQVTLNMLQQFHSYKSQHVADVCSWHLSYRAQLSEAREENCRLREQIWNMQAHAGSAHDLMRQLRKLLVEDEARHNHSVDDVAHRQEVRFWKRMALPQIPDDDPYWSDDDDLVDPHEKLRLQLVQAELAAKAAEAAEFEAAMIREREKDRQREEEHRRGREMDRGRLENDDAEDDDVMSAPPPLAPSPMMGFGTWTGPGA
ncbi:hypothetical protein Cpir12675_000414 [Ceratocystis pirilliformis]|uniref:Uncharacterized protein n=1 Tax=Ceratocystis pirilliformis TaxID=259994 RepID=A0ABR3ZN97_9PEZI